jgi:hypothetical protein
MPRKAGAEEKSRNQDCLLNGNRVYVTERTRMAEAVKEFWEDIGGVNEKFVPSENVISLYH